MQRRLVRLPNGEQAWIDLSTADEIRAVAQLPTAWREIVRARMNGDPVSKIYRMQSKLSFEEFQTGLWAAFGIVERYLWDVAEHRARQIVTQRQIARGAGGGVLLDRRR